MTRKSVNRPGECNTGNPYICKNCYKRLTFSQFRNKTIPKILDGGGALLVHDPITKGIVYGLKYSNKRDNAKFMAFETAKRFEKLIRRWEPDAIIPVPLHRKREFDRGFNQAELIAKHLAEELEKSGLHLPVETEAVIRTKVTKRQKELNPNERLKNIKGAFKAGKNAGKYKKVLLIDDIYTSGATLSECAAALKRAGVEKTFFITISIAENY